MSGFAFAAVLAPCSSKAGSRIVASNTYFNMENNTPLAHHITRARPVQGFKFNIYLSLALDSITSIINVCNMSLRIGQVCLATFHKDNLLRNASPFIFYKGCNIMEYTECYGTRGTKSKCENSLP